MCTCLLITRWVHYALSSFSEHLRFEHGETLPLRSRLHLLPLEAEALLHLHLRLHDLLDGQTRGAAIKHMVLPQVDLGDQNGQLLAQFAKHGRKWILSLLHQVEIIEDLGLFLGEELRTLAELLMQRLQVPHETNGLGNFD